MKNTLTNSHDTTTKRGILGILGTRYAQTDGGESIPFLVEFKFNQSQFSQNRAAFLRETFLAPFEEQIGTFEDMTLAFEQHNRHRNPSNNPFAECSSIE